MSTCAGYSGLLTHTVTDFELLTAQSLEGHTLGSRLSLSLFTSLVVEEKRIEVEREVEKVSLCDVM